MDSKYNHQLYEDKIYDSWEKQGLFNPDTNGRGETKTPFTIIMPPPNANDPLHIGHASFAALEDLLIRYHRMKGDDTLWQPGADHAGIETQFVYEKKLAKKKQSRFQFDREDLYQQIWDYVQENADTAMSQLKKIGASADWSRYKFTLDPDIVQTVLQTFIKLNEENLIYRDLKLVNFCPKCGTAFSDLEIKHEAASSPLYYLNYGPFIIATTRPETKFGDTAVAVHPDDTRYQKYIGQKLEIDGLIGKFTITVVADDYVDPEFGTGVVKVTPAHDHNDYEIYQRHRQEIGPDGIKQIIGFDGKLNQLTGPYSGLKVIPARAKIVADMQAAGLIHHIDYDYQNVLNKCYRCNSVLEPLPLAQLFIKVKPLTEPIIAQLKSDKIKVYGAGHDKILLNWLENLHDWNISRQIVWGIRQPIWYDFRENPQLNITFINKNKEKITGQISQIVNEQGYSLEEIKAGLQNLSADIEAKFKISLTEPSPHHIQETDTFDTWFSSSQWPFATLKNTNQGDFDRFYPTQIMETGYDILPFWVMRMLMMGQFSTGQIPFNKIYLHGLIRDTKGQKMSKSKGNVINPLEIIEKYGADALRMALIIRSSPGLDKSVGDADFKAMRNFTNKLWNASRFVLMQNEAQNESKTELNQSNCHTNDEALTTKVDSLIEEITRNIEQSQLGLAAETTYSSFWHYYCDEIIEMQKKGDISIEKLNSTLIIYLKLLHPFMPFITEQIWQEISALRKESDQLPLIVSDWPKTN